MGYSPSKFNMWRTCMAILHLDKRVSDAEIEWAKERIKNLDLTDTQKKTLVEDLASPLQFDAIFQLVTDKRDRAHIAHMLRVLGHIDGDFSAEEKNKLNEVEKKIMSGIDIKSLEEKIAQMEHESSPIKTPGKNSLLLNTFNSFFE